VSSLSSNPYECLAIAPTSSTSINSAFVFIKQLGSIQNTYMMKMDMDTGIVIEYNNDDLTS
jgi:hypothetical protein